MEFLPMRLLTPGLRERAIDAVLEGPVVQKGTVKKRDQAAELVDCVLAALTGRRYVGRLFGVIPVLVDESVPEGIVRWDRWPGSNPTVTGVDDWG